MQVAKGGCVGQTYALAKLNDSSGGKRSKRRSKDERKGMVETFVKRHQASNNGSFPSLHLTHKEVGGSYYTVREIFRELIQENRVLAPPKFPSREQNMENLDSFLENYPLGSISFDPNVHGLPPKDNQTLLNEYEFRRQKVFNSSRISELHKQNLDTEVENEAFKVLIDAEASLIPESDVVETNKIHEEQRNQRLELNPNASLGSEEVEESERAEMLDAVKEVVVESFPLRPVSSTIHNVDEKTSGKEVSDGDLESATGKAESFVNDEIRLVDNLNEVVDTKLVTSMPESKSIAGLKINKNLDSNNSSSSIQQLTFQETTANNNKSGIQPSGTAAQKKMVDATLDRINPESFEAAAKKSDSQEANPVVSFIKTFVAAFVKFWSE